jgi:hypothetical protein
MGSVTQPSAKRQRARKVRDVQNQIDKELETKEKAHLKVQDLRITLKQLKSVR